MQPELVSIAGVYRTFDDGFPAEYARQPAQIRLVGDRIDISSLNSATRACKTPDTEKDTYLWQELSL
jgi:septum site-determining protein MinC